MDPRRLDTAGLIGSGILGLRPPTTDIPDEYDRFDPSDGTYGDSLVDAEKIIAAIESGQVVTCSNYYGIPYAWKQGDGVYRGTLLQYRAITEDPTFTTAADLVAWFIERHWQTYG